MPAHYWLILGIALLIGEIFTADFSLSCFGLAAMISALASWAGLNLYWQIGIAAAAIFAFFFTLRPFMLKHMYKKGEGFKSNMDALSGKELTVCQADKENSKYYAKLDGDLWELSCEATLEKGDKVKVLKMEGIKLIVEKESK
ncbi:NfeD family protein [Candidatus Proelusimicrobium excrementi]|uniref:NfeD family protein n=1 Tax=Candidatus Proelusimicrobium excrementi TaxID=3416222 RepID=UPI003CA74679|nr:NfeD family protein [Elusimicrobiaceae bacterium]